MYMFNTLYLTSSCLANRKTDVCAYLHSLLSEGSHMPRDDHKELVQLSLIVLGEEPPAGVIFYKPGAIRKIRWKAVAIYGMKMFVPPREQMHLAMISLWERTLSSTRISIQASLASSNLTPQTQAAIARALSVCIRTEDLL